MVLVLVGELNLVVCGRELNDCLCMCAGKARWKASFAGAFLIFGLDKHRGVGTSLDRMNKKNHAYPRIVGQLIFGK